MRETMQIRTKFVPSSYEFAPGSSKVHRHEGGTRSVCILSANLSKFDEI